LSIPDFLAPAEVIDRPVYRFPGYFGRVSQCRLRIFRRIVPVIVLTERWDNPGASITNRAEYLAAQVAEAFELNPRAAVWIEHYPGRRRAAASGIETERFARLQFPELRSDWRRREIPQYAGGQRLRGLRSLGTPAWSPLTRDDVEGFTGVLWAPEWYEDQPAAVEQEVRATPRWEAPGATS
jgi:hypothetical protein